MKPVRKRQLVDHTYLKSDHFNGGGSSLESLDLPSAHGSTSRRCRHTQIGIGVYRLCHGMVKSLISLMSTVKEITDFFTVRSPRQAAAPSISQHFSQAPAARCCSPCLITL